MNRSKVVDKKEIFEQKPVPQAIAALAIPTILSQVITMIYNLADTFYVGHTGDPAQVAALTLVFPVYMLLTGIGNLFGIGANSRISRCLGVGDEEGVKRTCAFAFYSSMAVTAAVLVILGVFLDPILTLMGASSETLPPARGYIIWVMLVGGLPTEASLMLAHMLRGEGSAKEASLGMMLGGIFNIILDPIFIFPLGMGVVGAGLATMLANVLSCLYYIWVMGKKRNSSTVTLSPRWYTTRDGGDVLLVGLPAAMVIALGSSANIILTRLLSSYGDLPVAAFGVTQKFGTITMNITVGLTQGIMPLIGYNFAAKNYPRVKSICRYSFLILFAFVGMLFTLYQLIPNLLMQIFVSDAATVSLGESFLRCWSFCIPGMTFILLFNSIFQAMGMWKRSLMLSVMRQGLIFIPCLFILNILVGMYGLVWAQPVADSISVILGAILYTQVSGALKPSQQNQN